MEKSLVRSNSFYHLGNSNVNILILAIVLSLTVFIGSANNFYNTYQASNSPSHTYLVKLRELPIFGEDIYNSNSVDLWDFDDMIIQNNATVEDLYPDTNEGELGHWIIVKASDDIFPILANDYENIEVVEDGSLTLSLYSNLYYVANDNVRDDKTWGVRLPKAQEALDILKPVREIIVGVVDTGCDLNHPALKDRLVQGRNFAGGDANDASNRHSREMHSTHVTGTIVAKRDSDGFFGIANGIAKVMPVRVLDESGSGTIINVCKGIEWSANNGVNVINMSLGMSSYSRALHDVVKYAVEAKGVVVVCAKGNSNTEKPHYPSDLPEVIRVTATALKKDGTEERAYFSNYGKNSTCSAPGHYTYSTLPGGKYGFASGTSMACPHTTACVAVILSQGDFTSEQVKYILETRGDSLTTDKPIGKRINLLNFVQKSTHDLLDPQDIDNHPYRQCCIDAGIFERTTIREGPNSNIKIYQNSLGAYEATSTYSYGDDWGSVHTVKILNLFYFTTRKYVGIESCVQRNYISLYPPQIQ